MKKPLHRLDLLLAVLAAVLTFLLYFRTVVPGPIPNDSAEFQTLAYALDHAHTTGYAAYLILAHLFVQLPIGEVAYEVNLFSALMAAITIGIVFLAGTLLSRSRWGGLAGAAVLVVAPTFWSQAIIAEVYTAGTVFTAGALLALLWWWETRSARALFIAALLAVLGVNVHGSVLLLIPAAVLLVALAWKRPKKRFSDAERAALRQQNLRGWLPGLYGGLVGLALFLICFFIVDAQNRTVGMVGSAYEPSISRFGGRPEDIDSAGERFAFLVFARQWRPAMFVQPSETMGNNFRLYMSSYWRDTTLLTRLLVWAGLILLLARRWRLGVFFVTLVAVHWLYTFNYRIGDLYIFFLSLYVYYALLIAEAVGEFTVLVGRLTKQLALVLQPIAALALIALAVWPIFQPSLVFVQRGEARWDFMGLPSNQELVFLHSKAARNVEALPEDAVVLAGWTDLYLHVYVAQVEKNRGDVRFLEAYPYAPSDRMADTLVQFLREQLAQGRPVLAMEEYPELASRGFSYTERLVGMRIMYPLSQRK